MNKIVSLVPTTASSAESTRLSREDWVDAALQIFVEKGIDAVRIEPLAQTLSVTKGSFYWHFKNRRELHEALIQHWAERCTVALTRCLHDDDDIIDMVLNVFAMWMRDEPFSPRLDAAMRDWARRSDTVRQAVKQADQTRTDAFARAFQRAGFSEESAMIRARILYFTQIGYYEADLREPRSVRVGLWREYVKVLTDCELSQQRLEAFRDRNFTAEELAEPSPA